MPTTVWFSLLALAYVIGMSGYHGFLLVSRHVLPEPVARESPGWRSVRVEMLLTVMVLAPLLRRVLPALTWVKGSTSAAASVLYVLGFAWLPLLKCLALLSFRSGERKDRVMRSLYSVPLSALYVVGVAYLLFVTVTMMATR